MTGKIKIGRSYIGENYPVYFIAEIGINHNGSIDNVKKLIDMAVDCGANAVKFQKRTPEVSVPNNQKNVLRETPWGQLTYLEYKKKIELNENDFEYIDDYCKSKNIDWFCSCWDIQSLKFIKKFNPIALKIASASLTNNQLIHEYSKFDVPIILSTGMSTLKEIDDAVKILHKNKLLLAHCTSAYPCKPEELNLKMIQTLMQNYGHIVGYSGHETGISTSLAAVVLGAIFVERHITLDRSMWGTDQSGSLEFEGLKRLIRDSNIIKKSLGDGIKKVYSSEKKIIEKLRL